MNQELVHRALLGIIVLVFFVGFVLVAGPGITANVVQDDVCNCLPSQPVCAVVNGSAYDYASACEAECEGARIIAEGYCGEISANN